MKLQIRPAFLLACLIAVAAPSHAQTRVLQSVGIPQTGPNSFCGTQTWTLGGIPAGPASSGSFLGIEDPSFAAVEAIPITLGHCAGPLADTSLLLASYYDEAFGALRGWTAPDAALENLSLRRIPVSAGNGIFAPIPLPGSAPPNPLPPTITEPTDPISILKWLRADGNLEVTCDDSNGTAFIAAAMHDLVPNGVYTMWGHWADALGVLNVVPFGGLPNTIVADEIGDAEFCRELAYCPLDLAPDSSELQFLSLMYMAAGGQTFGAVPYEPVATSAFLGVAPLPFLSTTPGGTLSFDQLAFRINATGGSDPGPNFPLMCAGATPTVPTLSYTRGTLIGVIVATGIAAIAHRLLPTREARSA